MDKKVWLGMLTYIKDKLCTKQDGMCQNYQTCSVCGNWNCDSIRAMQRTIKFIDEHTDQYGQLLIN